MRAAAGRPISPPTRRGELARTTFAEARCHLGLLEQIDVWERAVARDERLRRLVPLEDDLSALSLPATAEAAALEQSSFSRHFRQVVGVPFRRWRAALRVSRALQLLRSSVATVEEVAREVGYADARSLRRAMKQHLGAGPAELRAAAGRSRGHANDP